MNKINIELSFEDRLNLNKEAGALVHTFGEGYHIIDEYEREVNTFEREEEFNRLIEKFRYRHFFKKNLTRLIMISLISEKIMP